MMSFPRRGGETRHFDFDRRFAKGKSLILLRDVSGFSFVRLRRTHSEPDLR